MEALESSTPLQITKHHSSSRLSHPGLITHTIKRPKQNNSCNAKKAVKLRKQLDTRAAAELEGKLTNNMKRGKFQQRRGASSWLAILPIDKREFALHKGAFRDAFCLRYGWRPSHLPSHCVRGHH